MDKEEMRKALVEKLRTYDIMTCFKCGGTPDGLVRMDHEAEGGSKLGVKWPGYVALCNDDIESLLNFRALYER